MDARPPPAVPSALSPAVTAFIQSGVSITLAGRGERLVPSISKAVGCHVDAVTGEVAVLAFAEPAGIVCRDIAHNGQVAVCFSRPSSNETVQLKGRAARSTPATPLEVAAARRCLDLLTDNLVMLGFQPGMIESVFWGNPAQLVAVRFLPESAFAQTPGPDAGTALRT